MLKKLKRKKPNVSIVIIHRNSTTTILHTLGGIKKQDYPVGEVIIVDDRSTDDSIEKIMEFSRKNKSMNIKIIVKTKKQAPGLSVSNNIGVKSAKSNHVLIMQADGYLPTSREISKIMAPVLEDDGDTIAAVNPITYMPQSQWNKYNFWEKCLLVVFVNKDVDNFNGKFNYINKKLFIKAGGFDESNFHFGMGGEDGDLALRLQKVGQVVKTKAKVIHLHYIGNDYSLTNWILNRKLLVRGYAKIMRMYLNKLPFDVLLINIKPLLVIASFIPFLFPYNLIILFFFPFLYMKRMYMTPQTISDPRILLLPFVSVFLLYYESFWMVKEFLVPIRKWEGKF